MFQYFQQQILQTRFLYNFSLNRIQYSRINIIEERKEG